MSTNSSILRIENLALAYNNRKIINDVNLSVKRGDIVTILGPNGGGKTSLVKAVAGINKIHTGSVIFASDVRVSYMPQNLCISNLMPITVEYFLLNSFTLKLRKDYSIITEAIELVGIKDILKNQVSEISAGQTQLLLLARCLITKPNLIILDEPVSAMDISARTRFYSIICNIAKERLVSVLMTSHDINSIVSCSDYIICINNTVYYQGKPSEFTKNRTLYEIFDSYSSE